VSTQQQKMDSCVGNFAIAWHGYCAESDGPCYVFLRRFGFNGFPLEQDSIANSIQGC
jgi:hypothetical protein